VRRAVAGALAACAAVAGCGGAGAAAPVQRRAAAVAPPATVPLQAANGPVAPPPATTPLTLRLNTGPDPIQLRLKHQPKSGLVFDLDTGDVLWRRLPARILPIASLTKMMTALLVVDRVPPGGKVLITRQALNYTGSGVGLLPLHRRIGVSTMLHGLLLPSGNDAAIALAQRVSGTVPRFVTLMNARAAAMGLTCTRFASPSGVIDPGNHSCATDLAVLARAVLDQPRLARIVRRRQAVLRFPIKGGRIFLYNHNPLLRDRWPGTLGIKTGYTVAAGRCLVAAVQTHGRRLGVVLLHSPDPGRQAERLLRAADRAIR
jgi:serine-type D-Ala-D-Ala carboxypeptidase (penicillin-binding protein 5/6)